MSFFYPRTIAITRQARTTGVGAQPYQGLNKATETTIATGVPAAIQPAATAGKPAPGLPSDASNATRWSITIPANAVPAGVLVRDIVTDDLGIRYQVINPYLTPIGYQLTADRLEA